MGYSYRKYSTAKLEMRRHVTKMSLMIQQYSTPGYTLMTIVNCLPETPKMPLIVYAKVTEPRNASQAKNVRSTLLMAGKPCQRQKPRLADLRPSFRSLPEIHKIPHLGLETDVSSLLGIVERSDVQRDARSVPVHFNKPNDCKGATRRLHLERFSGPAEI
jgi:hypothetical protein